MLRSMLNLTRTKAVSIMQPVAHWLCCIALLAACDGATARAPSPPPPLPATPAPVPEEVPALIPPVVPEPVQEAATAPAPEAEKAPKPRDAKAKVSAEQEPVKDGASLYEREAKKKKTEEPAPSPTPKPKESTETQVSKTPAPTPAPKPDPTGPAPKPVMEPPPPAPPAPVAYDMPGSVHVQLVAPKGLEADLAKDTRMKPWLQKSVAAATKCYAIEAKTTPKLAGTIEVGIVMHENDRPDAAIKKLPPQLSGVFACVSGAMMKSRMPLFTGREGQKYTARVVFTP